MSLKNPIHQSLIPSQLNKFFVTAYPLAFPYRKWDHIEFDFSTLTKSFTRYQELLRMMIVLFNCRALHGVSPGKVHLIGRIHSIQGLKGFFTRMISEVEGKVDIRRDQRTLLKNEGTRESIHLTRELSLYRVELIKEFQEVVAKVYHFKTQYYLDKYAKIRQVRSNEILDQTFFPEYIRENRLTHLKQYKWVIINSPF